MSYPRGQQFFQGVQQMRVLSRLSRTDELPCRYGLCFSTFMLQLLTMLALRRQSRVRREDMFGLSTAFWAGAFIAWM